MNEPTPEAVAAEAMQAEARNIALAWIEMAEMDLGPLCPTEHDREVLEVGIQAGYIGTLQMLQARGLLPGLHDEATG